jgi:hypothetical protein
MDNDVRGHTNVEQREERAEVPVCLFLEADGGRERERERERERNCVAGR